VRIAFVGLPIAALLLARDGHEIGWAGICRKDAVGVRRLARVLGPRNVVLTPDLTKCIDAVRATRPDLVVSWFWTRRVPRAFRALAPLGAIGVHPSILPRHRGPDPYFWTLDAGDDETGVTAHVLEDDYDTGAILARRTLRIEPTWNAWTLAKKLDRPSLALLREVVRAYAVGKPPAPVAQDETMATNAPSPTDDDLELRWSDASEHIERRVRAASPWPGAFTAIGRAVVVLTRVRPTTDYARALATGEAAVRADGTAVVRTADGAVELLAGRLDDDDVELDRDELAELVRAGTPRAPS
jgi:methionyl-tRNA formyltransferase